MPEPDLFSPHPADPVVPALHTPAEPELWSANMMKWQPSPARRPWELRFLYSAHTFAWLNSRGLMVKMLEFSPIWTAPQILALMRHVDAKSADVMIRLSNICPVFSPDLIPEPVHA